MRKQRRRMTGRRGTVMLLVVAVLTLLAVMGTAYLVMARVERGNARQGTDSVNLDFARAAVLELVRGQILDPTLDSTGVLAGQTNTGASGLQSRRIDFREQGASAGHTDWDPTVPDQQWLVKGQFLYDKAGRSNGFTYLLNVNTNTTPWTWTQNRFSPATGLNNLVCPVTGEVNVVGDPANLALDGIKYILPYSSGSGLRYVYSVRILDLDGLANLNVGMPAPGGLAGDPSYPFGTYLATYNLTNAYVYNSADAPNAAMLHDYSSTGPPLVMGRRGYSSTLTSTGGYLSWWQQQLLTYELPADTNLQFFDISDEMDLRSLGNAGNGYLVRPAGTGMWVNTLRAASMYRANFTTCSAARDLMGGVGTSGYTVTPGFAQAGWNTTVWPTAPARIGINPTMTSPTPASLDVCRMVAAATNVATAMQLVGYSALEARAFAANYLSYRYQPGKIISNGTYSTYNPSDATLRGISYVDTTGLVACGIAGGYAFGSGTDLSTSNYAGLPNTIFGYAPQPFLNEVATVVTSTPDPTGGPDVVALVSQAVELYNPYNVALDLTGWRLKVMNGSTPVGTPIDLGAKFPAGIPAGGYIVLRNQNATNPLAASGTPVDEPTFVLTGGLTLQLTRPYFPRVGGVSDALVDSIDYSAIGEKSDPALGGGGGGGGGGGPGGTTATRSVQRQSYAVPVTAPNWSAANATTVGGSYPPNVVLPTLGVANAGAAAPLAPRLWDRWVGNVLGTEQPTNLQNGSPLFNICDFNRIMRVANNTSLPLSTQIQNWASDPSYLPYLKPTDLPLNAFFHFDFKTTPDLFGGGPAPTPGTNPGDPRAAKLLEYLTWIDRVADPSIDIGGGPVDINKLRISGRINVNTACGEVLYGIPNITPQMVAAIMAYRDRTVTNLLPAPWNTACATPLSFTPAMYAGKGIRTLGELQIPILAALAGTAPPPPLVANTELDARDAAWGRIFGFCTVRSDTFVVYGYMEALRARFPATHNNGTDWYSGSESDDPNAATTNTRVASRRFVAIIDRSYCNYPRGTANFRLPRVVAVWDLPR